jgi:perosamine synthetase
MTEDEVEAVREVLLSQWTGLGPKTKEFEDEFAKFIGIHHAVSVNSCTAALDLALKLAGVNHGDEVIVPTMTFVSTAHAVVYRHATPIFCDVDPETLLIDFGDIARKFTRRTKAVIPVHYGGRMVDMEGLWEVINDQMKDRYRRVEIIEDCAHACGSRHKQECGTWYRAGAGGDIGCFSFHSVKNLSMGDGGMITTHREEYMERAKKLRWLGIDKGTWDRSEIDKSYWWEYDVNEVGLKCHTNDILSAIGLTQLRRLNEMNERRKKIADIYLRQLADVSQILLPVGDTDQSESSWHIFQIQAEERDDLATFLSENKISTGVHYKPIHMYGCYGNKPELPIAEYVWERLLSLPMHPQLSDGDARRVCDAIKKFYKKGGK